MATLTDRLRASPTATTVWLLVASVCTYTCMYAFRKPFAAGEFAGDAGMWDLQYKSLLIISQVLGYCLSKFIGIKIVAEVRAEQRALAVIGTITLSAVGLLLFAVLPRPWAAIGLFMNGLPLGMVWGLVFGFLEGRRTSDLLGAALCGCFIVSSGFVKSIGLWLMSVGVPETWMPLATGGLFWIPLLGFTWMLAQAPLPTPEDEAARTRRAPMDAAARWEFLSANALGLIGLTVGYMLITAYRDFRDNFAAELWTALGWGDEPAILTVAEIPVALLALVAVAVIYLFKSNERALNAIHAMMLCGVALVGASTAAMQLGWLDPSLWMVAVGLGLYVAYVPFNCVLFDRMLAALGSVGTAAFLITFTDAFGYLASVGVLFYKDFAHGELSWLEFFTAFSWATCVVGLVAWGISMGFFARRIHAAR